jgi:hypothetical protein
MKWNKQNKLLEPQHHTSLSWATLKRLICSISKGVKHVSYIIIIIKGGARFLKMVYLQTLWNSIQWVIWVEEWG